MKFRSLPAALIVSLVLVGCDSDDDQPTPTPEPATVTATAMPPEPTATSTAVATPAPAQFTTYPQPSLDEIFVYTMLDGMIHEQSRAWPQRSVVVQDLSSGRVLGRFRYTGPDGATPRYPVGAVLAGRTIVAATENAVTRYALDGSNPAEIFRPPDPQLIADIEVSRDGRFVAVTSNCYLACRDANLLTFIDVDSGAVVSQVVQSTPGLAGFSGDFWQVTWREDGSGVWVIGATYTEGGGGKAFVGIDKSVRQYSLEGWGFANLSPSGRYLAEGFPQIGCMRIGGPAFRVVDVIDDRVVANLAGEAGAYAVWEWSPDSTEVVFQFIPGDTVDGSCEWAKNPGEFRRYSVASGAVEPVTSLADRHRTWYGDRLVEVVCEEAYLDQPVLSRYGTSVVCRAPSPGEVTGDLFVGGMRVARLPALDTRGSPWVEPVGFVVP